MASVQLRSIPCPIEILYPLVSVWMLHDQPQSYPPLLDNPSPPPVFPSELTRSRYIASPVLFSRIGACAVRLGLPSAQRWTVGLRPSGVPRFGGELACLRARPTQAPLPTELEGLSRRSPRISLCTLEDRGVWTDPVVTSGGGKPRSERARKIVRQAPPCSTHRRAFNRSFRRTPRHVSD